MLDVEKFLIALRSNKDLDGKLKPIFLADTVQEEIKIIQAAVENSRREWVGLTDEEIWGSGSRLSLSERGIREFARAIEAKLREKNGG
jgi:hypothetical protein